VLVALMLTVILLLAALAIDGGSGYQSHRQSQNAADSGAMTGAQGLEMLLFSSATSWTVTNLATKIRESAQNTGDGTEATAVRCWLLAADGGRVTGDFCATGSVTNGQLSNASGVEAEATIVRRTYFASVAGVDQTSTAATARAFVQNLGGTIATPFIICGVRPPAQNNTDSFYDMLKLVGGKYQYQPGVVGSYYALQAAQVPDCGVSNFKGKSASSDPPTVPGYAAYEGGNGFSATIGQQVSGIVPCTTVDNGSYNGCGMLIPVADGLSANGSKVHLVTWLVLQVYSSGFFSGSYNDTLGTSCRNPFIGPNGGSLQYCGKVVNLVSVANGKGIAGVGPDASQPHVINLTA
jgi:hypothetical protein